MNTKKIWVTVVEVLLVCFVVILLGSYYFAHKKTTQNPGENNQIMSGWQTYRNEKYGYEIKYPPFWEVNEGHVMSTQSTTTVISPKGSDSQVITIGGWESCLVDNLEKATRCVDLSNWLPIYIYTTNQNELDVFDQIVSTLKFTDSIMISEDSETEGVFKGYYFPYKKTLRYEGNPEESATCDGFVVKSGDDNGKLLMNYFSEMVDRGNTVNRKTERGDLVVNLDLRQISDEEKVKLVTSNPDNEISISIKKKIEAGRDAPICFSFVNLEKIENQALNSKAISDWKTYQNTKYGFEFKYPPNSKPDIISDSLGEFFLHVDNLPRVNPKTISTGFQLLIRDVGNYCVVSTDEKIKIGNTQYSTSEGFTFGVLVGDATPHYSKDFITKKGDKCIIASIEAWWTNYDQSKIKEYVKDVQQFDPNFDPAIETKAGVQILESLKFTK